MRQWRIADGGTLEESEHNGEVRYLRRDPQGVTRNTYEPRTDSVEDTLYKTRFTVRAGCLMQHTAIETYDEPSETKDQVVLEGLAESHAPQPPPGIAAKSSDAREGLLDRVRQHQDKLAATLLKQLHRLDALQAALSEGAATHSWQAIDAAAQELTGTARIITFADTSEDREQPHFPHACNATPKPPTGPMLNDARGILGEPSNTVQQHASELIDHLEELLRELVFQADTQGYVDARGNESAYLRAATRVSRAATLVATACSSY